MRRALGFYHQGEPRDTEGLPPGYYRRKDGIICSFGSSADSTSEKSERYKYKPGAPSREPSTELVCSDGISDARRSISTWGAARNTSRGAFDETKRVIDVSISRPKNATSKTDSILDTFVQSFEDHIENIRVGLHFGNSTRASGEEIPCQSSASYSVRRGKMNSDRDFDLDSNVYDDSTITTKDSGIDRTWAVIDMATLGAEDRNDFMVATDGDIEPRATTKEDEDNSLLLLHRYEDMHVDR
jgi:hypothetical protein